MPNLLGRAARLVRKPLLSAHIGITTAGVCSVACKAAAGDHCERGSGEVVLVISAQMATKRESAFYRGDKRES